MYTRLTLLTDNDLGSPKDIWQRYHGLSDSSLLRQGRTL